MSSKADVCARVLVLIASFFAGSFMLFLARETKTFMEIDRHVSFSDLTPYVCFVIANFVVGGYSALLCILPSKSQLWNFVVAIDAILLVGLTSSCSAALSIGIMEYVGNTHACWLPICNSFHTYCIGVFVAVGFSYVGALIYLILLLLKIQEGFNVILV